MPRIVILTAAVGSLALMLWPGGHNRSYVLLFLFAIWVLAPFAAMLCTGAKFVPLVAIGSLTVYCFDAMRPAHPQAAFIYVVVPPVSFVLLGVLMLTGRRRLR